MTQSAPELSRRAFVIWLGANGTILLPGCCSGPSGRLARPAGALPTPIDRSLARAAQFLAARQSPDGAWRSDVYGFFKDGPTLTPHVLAAVAAAGIEKKELHSVIETGADYLARQVDEQGNVLSPMELIYPAYIAADASRVLTGPAPARRKARAGWLGYLLRHQLAEPLGWGPADVDYGGWGYAREPPQKAQPGALRGPWDWSNLSATVYALDALRSAGVPASDPVCGRILTFVRRCQNFSEADGPPAMQDATTPPGADGGFFFGPSASIRNKAGASSGPDGRERFNSYGSTTCDGLRALLKCGLPHDHPRIVAARGWIERNFSVAHHPGDFVSSNEDLRDATYYYYVRSLSLTLPLMGRLHSPPNGTERAGALAAELINRQRPDGSWANHFTDGKEDDRLVATPFAVLALANSRRECDAPIREWQQMDERLPTT
jgi:hypothetical protein